MASHHPQHLENLEFFFLLFSTKPLVVIYDYASWKSAHPNWLLEPGRGLFLGCIDRASGAQD